MAMEFLHKPVLFDECMEMLEIKPDGIYVDGTLGGGGHSSGILSLLEGGRLIGIDRDEAALAAAGKKLEPHKEKVTFVHSNYSEIKRILDELEIKEIDGALLDLGVSSYQLDNPERGFSYMHDAPLDMRMNQSDSKSAYDVVNTYSEKELCRILYDYGEEKFSSNIAKKIEKYRQNKTIDTTLELVEVIKSALPAAVLRKTGHPAKKIFQAIRIEVNKELSVFQKSLVDAFDVLNLNGRIVVITFHSLEDRLCKRMFKEKSSINLPSDMPIIPKEYLPEFELVHKKAILPQQEELLNNNRAHSAKLRAIRKIKK